MNPLFVKLYTLFKKVFKNNLEFNGDPLHRIELALVNYLKPNPSNIDKINAIYESILVGNHWDSFARYNLSMGNEAKARSIYKRGVNERPYDQELKMKWLEFEQEFSSDHLYEAYDRVLGLEKIVEVEVKKSNKRGIDVDVEMSFKKQKGILFANLVVKEVKDVTIKAPKEEKEPTEKPAIESFYTVYSPLGGNMIRVTNMISPTVSNLTSKFQQFGPIIEVLVDESIPAAIIEFSNAESVRKSMSLNGNECSIQRCRPEKLVWNFETEINESKIHVSKLSKQTTKPELRELFKVFGEIKDIRIVDGKGKSCSAFIEFSNKDSASKSLTLDQSTFLGRVITVAVSNPSQKNKVNFNELFVGNLPYTATNADLVELFGKNVKNVRLLKGTAFVEFHDPESAKAGLLLTGTFVNGRMISVSYPDPNFKHRETRVDQDEFKMSFVPRTVKSRAARPAPKISLSATKEEGKTQDDFKRMMDLDK